jgi:hypothetical protein
MGLHKGAHINVFGSLNPAQHGIVTPREASVQ